MIKISIVIATYNAGEVLGRCLGSIVRQLSKDVELIIIDGGSQDKTLDVINSFRGSISYVVSEPDKGIYDAWNKGIHVAKGEWIMFIGADDVLLDKAIDIYLESFEANDLSSYDFISAHNQYVNNTGVVLKILGDSADWNRLRKGMAAAHVGSLHNKRNLFNKVGVYDLNYSICADYELLLRKGNKLRTFFIDKEIAKMTFGGMSFSKKAIDQTFNIRKKHKSLNSFVNILIYFRDLLAFNIFKFRNNDKLN
ncbi:MULTISPECIES: glycosyltransferase family 2 protein [Sphingobacterium]|uniref:glycosyltransferase family 2 protein n=1 Tax=Sphingobacterium TaxID=28453 RepID=UPI00257B4F9B|nr:MULTISPECIES: glycosyltransferase family 2 protein [Sphingobacterium]